MNHVKTVLAYAVLAYVMVAVLINTSIFGAVVLVPGVLGVAYFVTKKREAARQA